MILKVFKVIFSMTAYAAASTMMIFMALWFSKIATVPQFGSFNNIFAYNVDTKTNNPTIAIDIAPMYWNAFMIAMFGMMHSIMASQEFKKAIYNIKPKESTVMERGTFLLSSVMSFYLVMTNWKYIEGPTFWSISNETAVIILRLISFSGFLFAGYTTSAINHFDFFGIRQLYFELTGKKYVPSSFVMQFPYDAVRHPMMVGILVCAWTSPEMTFNHFCFSLLITVYIVIGSRLEEIKMESVLGNQYKKYRESTGMFIPSTSSKPKVPYQ